MTISLQIIHCNNNTLPKFKTPFIFVVSLRQRNETNKRQHGINAFV